MSRLDQLISWLNTAHAIELALAKVLDSHAAGAHDFPDLAVRLEQHAAETRGHAERVKECLALLEQTPSGVKSILGNMTGMAEGATSMLMRDELMKNAVMDYASEHLEIATYGSIIAAAEAVDEIEIADVCREIMREEIAMAKWLGENIPEIARLTLAQHAST